MQNRPRHQTLVRYPRIIVLKIYTDKLTGRLIYESNSGGSSKYYHLYNGFIPLNAVFESKTIKDKYWLKSKKK